MDIFAWIDSIITTGSSAGSSLIDSIFGRL